MNDRKKNLLQKLDALSRRQAPDNWTALRQNIEQAAPRTQPAAAQQKRSDITMRRQHKWLIAASAAVLILALTLSLSGLLLPKPTAINLTAGQTVKLANGNLAIHAITRTGGRIGMPPDAEIVELTLSDLPAIFGRDPIPDLPLAVKPEFETISAMMFRSGSVFLMNGITYGSGDPAGARVIFDLNDRGDLPLSDCSFGSEQMSTWDGIELMLGIEQVETETGSIEQYIARFVVHDIGYQIQASGLTGEQFLAVLSAVIAG
jgi:hypothetical protein